MELEFTLNMFVRAVVATELDLLLFFFLNKYINYTMQLFFHTKESSVYTIIHLKTQSIIIKEKQLTTCIYRVLSKFSVP